MPNIDSELLAHFQGLEESLWIAESRFDTVVMDQTFAPDFIEIGRSGRTYSREQMLFDPDQAQPIEAVLPLPNFEARMIGDGLIQVTYTSHVTYDDVIEHAKRSSIWRKTGERWQLVFHQGTAFEPE